MTEILLEEDDAATIHVLTVDIKRLREKLETDPP